MERKEVPANTPEYDPAEFLQVWVPRKMVLSGGKAKCGFEKGSEERLHITVEIEDGDDDIVALNILPDVNRMFQEYARRASGREELKDRRETDAEGWAALRAAGRGEYTLSELHALTDRGKRPRVAKKEELAKEIARKLQSGELTEAQAMEVFMAEIKKEAALLAEKAARLAKLDATIVKK